MHDLATQLLGLGEITQEVKDDMDYLADLYEQATFSLPSFQVLTDSAEEVFSGAADWSNNGVTNREIADLVTAQGGGPVEYVVAVTTNVGESVAMTSVASDPTNTSSIPVVVTFNESVIGFEPTDITVANGMVNNFSGGVRTTRLT